MFKKLTQALMALTFAFGLAMSAASDAEARRGSGIGLGIAAGIIGLGVLGAAASARGYPYDDAYYDGPDCYRGPRECRWTGRRCFENRWGDFVCRGGRYICERPLICD